MQRLRNNWPLALLLGLGLLLRLLWAAQPFDTLLRTLEDDAWMVTAIARHWALGHGITADGLTPTNGFHPLYPLTIGALPYLIAPDNLDFGFRANLVLCAILSTLQLMPFYALLRGLVRRELALFGVATLALNPFLIRTSVNAMETALALLTLTTLWWYALQPLPLTRRRTIILGVLAAIATLARLDSMLAAALLGIVLLWRDLRARRVPWLPILYGAVTLTLLLPYFVRNVVQFGAISPSSGRALAYLHSYKESYTFSAGVQMLAYNSALDLSYLPAWALAALIAGLLGMLWWLRQTVLARISPLVVYAFVLTFYYSYLQQQGSPRYYGGVALVLVVIVACGLEQLALRRPTLVQKPLLLGLLLVFMTVNSLETINYVREQRDNPASSQTAIYDTALWVRDNLPSDALIGSQNSGLMQYYSGHVVLNFDGKLNHEIIPVLEQRQLNVYLASKGMEYIVDLPEVENYVEFYSAHFSVAKPHLEPGTLGKIKIYARLIAHKLGLGPAVELDVREPERIIRPFRDDATIVHTTPLPNNPQRAVNVYRLEAGFGAP